MWIGIVSVAAKRIKASTVPIPSSTTVTPSRHDSSPAAPALSVADDGATTDDARSSFEYGGYQDEEESIHEKAALLTGVPAKSRCVILKVSCMRYLKRKTYLNDTIEHGSHP